MNGNERATREWDRALDRLAADLATTAYTLALRHGAGGSWVDLELALWVALTGTVREWGHRHPGPPAERLLPGGCGNPRTQTTGQTAAG